VRLRPSSNIGCVIQGEDLAVAVVRRPIELLRPVATVVRTEFISGFLTMDPAQRRAALRGIVADAGSGARVILTVPTHWCALRPISVVSSQWAGARDEIVRSIDRVIPLTPDDAEVGLIDLTASDASPDDPATGGVLIGVDRSRADQWRSALGEAIGRPVALVISPHMAALGLGLQHEEHAQILEQDGSTHTMRWGRYTAIGDLDNTDGGPRPRRIELTEDPEDEQGGPIALAIGAAIAPDIAGFSFRPVSGPAPRAPRRWLAPAACAAIAMGLFVLAGSTERHRFQQAVAQEQARQAQLADELAETQRLRLEAERLTRLVNDGVVATAEGWSSMLPALIEAQRALPENGALHRLELDGDSVELRGETASAGDALKALEASEAFTDASFTAPLSKSPDGADLFELRAKRAAGQSKGDGE